MKKIFLALLEISLATLWLLNFFSGIVGAIWLIFAGGWALVALGLLYSFVMPWGYTIASLPTWLLIPLVVKASEKGMRYVTAILGFILSGYNNFIISLWVIFVFSFVVNQYEQFPLIALLLWGYSVSMGPIGYMASKEGPNAGTGTTLGVLYTQVAYLTLTVNTILAFLGFYPFIPLWLILLIFTGFTAWMGFLSVPRKTKEKLEELDNYPTDTFNDIKTADLLTSSKNKSKSKIADFSSDDIEKLTEKLDEKLLEGDFKNVITICKQILKRDSSNIRATFNLGLSYQRMKKYKSAIKYYNKTLKLDENHLIAMTNKALCLSDSGEIEESKLIYKNLLKLAINNGNKEVAMTASYNLDNFGECIDIADDLLGENANDLDALFYKSLALKDSYKYSEALDVARKLLDLQPENIHALGVIGDIFYKTKNYKESIDVYTKLLKINPNDPNATHGIQQAKLELSKIN